MTFLRSVAVAMLAWACGTGCTAVGNAVAKDPLLGSKSGTLPSEFKKPSGL